jgi:hypothetical protein
MDAILKDAEHTRREGAPAPSFPVPAVPVPAFILMMAFWTLLGAAAGINVMQGIWRVLGVSNSHLGVTVPVGAGVGGLAGLLLGLIRNPRVLVLLMAVFAGSAAGTVAGRLAWGDIGEISGQIVGGLVGGIAWATWLYLGRSKAPIP